MCWHIPKMPDAPSVPPPPPAPVSFAAQGESEAAKETQRRGRMALGGRATQVTGAAGVTAPAATAQKSLIGGAA